MKFIHEDGVQITAVNIQMLCQFLYSDSTGIFIFYKCHGFFDIFSIPVFSSIFLFFCITQISINHYIFCKN